MTQLISALILAGVVLTGQVAAASREPASKPSLEVQYNRFYSHMRKLEGEDTQALQFAFGFLHVNTHRLCRIQQASIVTPKKTMPVTITDEQRFTLPSEKALTLADASVTFLLEDPANQCDMSVQLETKAEYLKQHYDASELGMLVDQYSAFFNEMGSFLSFMMPSVKGLTIQFANPDLTMPLKNGLMIQGGMLQLSEQWLNQKLPLTLPVTPIRITAIATRQ